MLHCAIRNCVALLVVGCGLVYVSSVHAQTEPRLSDRLSQESLEQLASDAEKFGNPARGALAFYQPTLNCVRCHQASEGKRQLGPELAEKREVDWKHLAQSILKPSAEIKKGFQTLQVLTDDGKVISGILKNETDDQLEIDQIQFQESLFIDKESIEDRQWSNQSSMPEGLANQLTDRQQFLDLISYLAAIAEGGQITADQLKPNVAAMAPLPEYEKRVDHAGLIRSRDASSLANGAEIYRLRCASCHGTVEQEGSMPTSMRFASGQFKHGSDPLTMYRTLTHGYGMMIPQRWMVPQQKYDVIHYIREHFLRPHNAQQLFEITPEYLASLPAGDTFGPEPVVSTPWTVMDYGPSLNNTIEVSRDGSNIAQKGIVVRLDDGPGGVESGQYWMLYEHDTLRLAGAWQGKFVDFEGIHFNGAHGAHPKVTGEVVVQNPTAPGFADPTLASKPISERFQERRVKGRDGKFYGPLPKQWAQFQGMYRFGRQTVLKYQVGEAEILESPGLEFSQRTPLFLRRMELGKRNEELVMQLANVEGCQPEIQGNTLMLLPPESPVSTQEKSDKRKPIRLRDAQFFQLEANPFNLSDKAFSIAARIKTTSDGTIFCKTRDQKKWLAEGKSLFIRDGRPTFDIGWVGAVRANRKINDGKFHDVVMTWDDGEARFFIDGKSAGGGEIQSEEPLSNAVIRIGKTNDNFPASSEFDGVIDELRFYQRQLDIDEIRDWRQMDSAGAVAVWNHHAGNRLAQFSQPQTKWDAIAKTSAKQAGKGLMLTLIGDDQLTESCRWVTDEQGNVRLKIPAGESGSMGIAYARLESKSDSPALLKTVETIKIRPLKLMTQGGPANYPEVLTTEVIQGDSSEPFAVDVFRRPDENPWNCRMRLTGVDFMSDANVAVVTAWDGSVWKVTGVSPGFQPAGSSEKPRTITWRRFANGLFQPLGVRVIKDVPYVICRDQLVALHDLNGDGEADWYQNINSDHQVTEHFHEFAAGLQTDEHGNFYYAKCARHAKQAIVPQHGTLLKISADGSKTEILANGFRAPNGVCLNDDGSFFLTDQEGHWTPKNRINHVQVGRFYGNMMGYHDGVSQDDNAMEEPVCWITNAFDRSPSELLWVDSDRWGPLNGKLLNLSYGYGQVYLVNRESVDNRMQGGMTKMPIPRFPTGIMRGRFHPVDQQLYCCGMFAWAGNQQQPGGFYRIRYTGKPVHLPEEIHATESGLELVLTEPVDIEAAAAPENYRLEVWDLMRASRYGSKHFNQRQLDVEKVDVSEDGKTIRLQVTGLKPTRGMKLNWSLRTPNGKRVQGEYHGSIYKLKSSD